MFRLEKDNKEESKTNLKTLLQYLEDFVYVGYYELRVSSSLKTEMYQLPGFKIPHQPLGKGLNFCFCQKLINKSNQCCICF